MKILNLMMAVTAMALAWALSGCCSAPLKQADTGQQLDANHQSASQQGLGATAIVESGSGGNAVLFAGQSVVLSGGPVVESFGANRSFGQDVGPTDSLKAANELAQEVAGTLRDLNVSLKEALKISQDLAEKNAAWERQEVAGPKTETADARWVLIENMTILFGIAFFVAGAVLIAISVKFQKSSGS